VGNLLKAITGAVEAAAMRLARGGDRCERHGLRLRRVRREQICPACRWRVFSMRIYPVNLYVSRSGLVAFAVVSAIGAAVVFGVVPGVAAVWRDNIKTSAETAAAVDAMPVPWGSLYLALAAMSSDRGVTFMEFATGSREMKPGKRAPVRTDMPALSPDGAALFAKLFNGWDAEYVVPVLMTMSFGQPVQRQEGENVGR
jgi:hypothetical protein